MGGAVPALLNIDIGKMWKYGTAKWQNDNAFQYKWRCVWESTLIKKKIKFSSYIGKFRMEQLQSHI
jgi:hypothetical protein